MERLNTNFGEMHQQRRNFPNATEVSLVRKRVNLSGLFNEEGLPYWPYYCVVIGQPGGGKTRLSDIIARNILGSPNIQKKGDVSSPSITVNSDIIKKFAGDDLEHASLLEYTIRYGIHFDRTLIAETTLRNFAMVTDQLGQAIRHGTPTFAAILLVHPLLSRFGYIKRELEGKGEQMNVGVDNLRKIHDQSIRSIQLNTRTLLETGLVMSLSLYERLGEGLSQPTTVWREEATHIPKLIEWIETLMHTLHTTMSQPNVNYIRGSLTEMRRLAVDRPELLKELTDIEYELKYVSISDQSLLIHRSR